MSDKLTRQGVRDLDAKLGRPKRKRVEEPPEAAFICTHRDPEKGYSLIEKDHMTGDTYCGRCGQIWDWYGKSW